MFSTVTASAALFGTTVIGTLLVEVDPPTVIVEAKENKPCGAEEGIINVSTACADNPGCIMKVIVPEPALLAPGPVST
jgi:hypothetical protein